MNRPRVLLLDFGAVISKSLFETVDDIERCFKLPPGTLDWHGPFRPDADALWRDMQANRISEREYWYTRARELSSRINEELTIQDIILRSRPVLDDICRPQAVSAIDTVHSAGGVVAIATNELLLFYGSERVNASAVIAKIDHIFDSSYTRILKPDARAYAGGIAGLNVNANDIVFIDDQQRNVDGAIASGITGIHLDIREPDDAFERALAQIGADSPAASLS